MWRGADARQDAARRAAIAAGFKLFEKERLRQQKVDYIPSMKPPSMAAPSSCPSTDGVPCKHIRQAAARKHLECVKHFWGLRSKGNPEEEYFERYAVFAALNNKDVALLEYLLSRSCPSDSSRADCFFLNLPTSAWNDWHDMYDIAFKYKLPSPSGTKALLQKFMTEGRWDFLEKVRKYGHTFEEVNTRVVVSGPDGANIAALKVLLERKAFRTADLRWLTPGYAAKVNDLPLLKFACEMRPRKQVAAARANVENPEMREWLDNHLKNGRYPKIGLMTQ